MARKLLTFCIIVVVSVALCLGTITDAFGYLWRSHSLASKMTITDIHDIPEYHDSYELVQTNPERGFYNTSFLKLGPTGKLNSWTRTKSDISKLLFLKVDLSAFSDNMGAEGSNIWITGLAVQALKTELEKIKQNDNTVILRFVYDNEATAEIKNDDGTPKSKVEPTQWLLIDHIRSLGSTEPGCGNVFREYASTINAIQVGFYGLWGECFYNTDAAGDAGPQYYRDTINKLLEVTSGTDITIAVRTPEYYSWYRNIGIGNIASDITTSEEEARRVCVFNDAYGGSANDLGTYHNRDIETRWLSRQATGAVYGGEAIVDEAYNPANPSSAIGPYNTPEFFVNEAFKVHTTYLNAEWNTALHEQWKAMTYAEDPAYSYISNHLGYRFILRGIKHYTENSEPTGVWGEYPENTPTKVSFDIMIGNTGFANVVKQKKAEILIMRPSGELLSEPIEIDFDVRDLKSRNVIKKNITLNNVTLPNKGDYKVFLRFSSGETLNNDTLYSAIAFTNSNIYNEDLQANLVTTLRVTTGTPDNPETPPPPQKNFAVYSATDNSLNFYRMDKNLVPTAPTPNWDGAGHEATAVYTDFEMETSGALAENGPWFEHKDDIKSVKVVSSGIRPRSTAYWFNGFSKLEKADLLKLDVSRVTNMESMFNSCSSEKFKRLDLSTWNTANVTNMSGMFAWCNWLTTIYAGDDWSVAKVTAGGKSDAMFNSWNAVLRGGAGTTYPANTPQDAWFARIDQGVAGSEGYFTRVYGPDTVVAFAVYSSTDESLKLYRRAGVPVEGQANWNGEGREATEVYTGFDKGQASILASNAPWRARNQVIKTVEVVDEGIRPDSCAYWFNGFKALESADLRKLDTSNVTNMEAMFNACESTAFTTLDLSTWDTANVTNFNYMFAWCNYLTTIYAGDKWSTAGLSHGSSVEMFKSWNNALVGGGGNRYNYGSDPTNPVGRDGYFASTRSDGYLTYKAPA